MPHQAQLKLVSCLMPEVEIMLEHQEHKVYVELNGACVYGHL